MILYTWEERKIFLNTFSADTVACFGETDYNVLVFGSYLRSDYRPGESDLDLAIYADDYGKELELLDFLEDYLGARGIPCDIIQICPEQNHACIALAPLGLRVGFTDYYPQWLLTYQFQLTVGLIYQKEEQRMMQLSIVSPGGVEYSA